MKILTKAALAAVIIISSVSARAQISKAEVQVSGLTCSMCQLATQKSLKTIDFISDIKPDLNTNSYVLSFKKDRTIDLDRIRKKVKDAGFSVSKMIITLNFDKLSISNDFHYKYGSDWYHFMNVPKETLNGPVRLTVISNGFIPPNEFKKYAAQTTYPCYKTGMMGNERVFHVTI